jgi:uncharacterized protein (DUF2235 family)
MAKNIVFCADGTWNSPDQDENQDQCADPTNVYKLFLLLAGELSPDTLRCADEQEKTATSQVSKYLHGVGDSRNPINHLMGGAFGAGIISRIVRGYTFISRNYQPDDNIYIVGFSRGAYTARALAGLIASQGLLCKRLAGDPETAYRSGAQAWYRSRKTRSFSFARVAEIAADLPAFVSMGNLSDEDLVPVDRISAVAVWDTVGAMGIPIYQDGACMDAFRFADTKLSSKVVKGLHAVSLDERRVAFTPTLWDAAANVTQLIFPGAHADVGGGYPVAEGQSGLSDTALQWMAEQLSGAGVQLSDKPQYIPAPDVKGTAHQPWTHAPWPLECFPKGPRNFAQIPGLSLHPSVEARMEAGNVLAEPGATPGPYRPGNRP